MQGLIKPMLAVDVQEEKLKFPLLGQYKIDGVRGLVQNGKLYARSLKQHENKYVTQMFSNNDLNGLDGEIILGSDPTAKALCRNTSGAIRRIEGEPVVTFYAFDLVTADTKNLPYEVRYQMLIDKVTELQMFKGWNNITVIKAEWIKSKEEYEAFKQKAISMGYEGIILRDPMLPHKEGRSSKSKVHVWRWKPFLTAECLCTGITEGTSNENEKTTNELGRSTRSSHQENLVPNGLMGSIQGTLVADLLDISGNLIAKAGTEITVSAGETTLAERKEMWDNPSLIVGKLVEFEYFAFGCKDKPRYPVFKCIRSEVNI